MNAQPQEKLKRHETAEISCLTCYNRRMDFNNEYDRPSKTTLKRDADDVRKLGKQLCKLSAKQLARVPLPKDALIAIKDSPKIYQNVAKKRHFQYIGKLLRSADLDAIKDELGRIEHGLPSLKAIEKSAKPKIDLITPQIEQLFTNGDPAIQEMIEKNPDIERSHLRQLVRNAKKKPGTDSKPIAVLRHYLSGLKL